MPTSLTSLKKLYPVHRFILLELVELEPLKTLTLSRAVYDVVVPQLYRHVKASRGLLCGLECSDYSRKLQCLSFVKVLTILDMPALWYITVLSHPLHQPQPHRDVFPNVNLVVLSQEVVSGNYHEVTGAESQSIVWSMEGMRQRMALQLPATYDEEILGNDKEFHRSMIFYAPGAEPIEPKDPPVPNVIKARKRLWVLVRLMSASFTFAILVLLISNSLSNCHFRSFNIVVMTANGSGDENTAFTRMTVCPGLGCQWYGNDSQCERGLDFQPNSTFFRLSPSNSLPSFPHILGEALILNHITFFLSLFAIGYMAYHTKGLLQVVPQGKKLWMVVALSATIAVTVTTIIVNEIFVKTLKSSMRTNLMGWTVETGKANGALIATSLRWCT
ncbi:uncharacterized protein L203_104464 [Cryptococcus depauperatus CBS 7841]|uniref:Uncharacterized protein n=1 Tax=Cryptococcus depauperatus CBS 7841 TaxID=1295531 RepID=A0A1E3IG88_9TREE|nr:hypothetical protein L203_03404 [Cryptococcus depauperatus CBS 7841]